MSSTNLERLEAAQRFAGRAVTGQLKTTPNEAVLLDAGLPTIKERCKFIAINALEKSMRLDPSNPRRQIAEKPQHRRLKKTDWRDHARDKWNEIFTEGCNPEPFPDPVAPWTKLSNCAFTYTIVEKRQDDETKKKAGEEAINLNHDTYKLNIYTDGSAQDSNKNGGAGVVIVPSDPEEETTMLSHPAGKLTSSFQAELTAINHALKHVASNDHHDCQIRIITDSKSALQRCESITSDQRLNSWLEREVLDSLMTLGERQVGIVFLWCPSHCGLWENEEADRCAAEGSAMSQDNIPWTYHSAQAKIRRNIKNTSVEHPRCKRVYCDSNSVPKFPLDEDLTRREQVTLSRLRSGHHTEIRYWRINIDDEIESECRTCGLAEETMEHIMEDCPTMRNHYPEDWNLHKMTTNPRKALEIWQRFLTR